MKKYTPTEHGRPVTRRDFLSRGLIGFSGLLTMPSLGLFLLRSSRAFADGEGPLVPYLAFDLAGGAALPGNFLVGKGGGPEDLLSSYSLLGWDPRASNALNRSMGLPMAANNVGQILSGILQTTTAEARNNLRFGSCLHFSQDDSSSNPLSIVTLAARAGLRGSFISNGLGLIGSNSGGNSDVVYQNVAFKPLQLRSLQDLLQSGGGFSGALSGQGIPLNNRIGQALQSLGLIQAPRYQDRRGGDTLMGASQSAYTDLIQSLNSAAQIDPRTNPSAQQIYGINTGSNVQSRVVLEATIAAGVINGLTGPGVITIGGCDYHDGSQTSGDTKDLEIGLSIGRAVQLAHLLQKPLFLHIFTDGGIYSQAGSRRWRGDAGDKSMSVLGYYHPTITPTYRTAQSMQIGRYTDGQGADRNTLIGGSAAKAAYATFANYLNIIGRINQFEVFAPGVFSNAELDSVLIFSGAV